MFFEILGFLYFCVAVFYFFCGVMKLTGFSFALKNILPKSIVESLVKNSPGAKAMLEAEISMRDPVRFESWFPLVSRMNLDNFNSFLVMLAVVALVVTTGVGVWLLSWWGILLAFAIAVFEVYLGATFYLYGRTPGEHSDAVIHMLIHAVIAGIIVGFVDFAVLGWTISEMWHNIFG